MASRTSLWSAAAAIVLVVVVTFVQGRWTERWSEKQDDALADAGRLLERSFPTTFGEWRMDRPLETSKAELERAGAVGSISRVYRNEKTKTAISAFVVCATPHDASGHTPDRCYPGAGFEIAEPEHRETIPTRDGRSAETYTGTFAKEGQTLRVFWTYGVPARKKPQDQAVDRAADAASAAPAAGRPATLDWVAPQIARIALHDYPAVYKLYAIIDQTKMPSSRATAECGDFISELLPALDAALAGDVPGPHLAEPMEPVETPPSAPGETAG